MITNEELQVIRERAGRATPGPWEIFREFNIQSANSHRLVAGSGGYSSNHEQEKVYRENVANAQFIAHARQDIPDLLTKVEWLQGEIEYLSSEVGRVELLQDEVERLRDEVEYLNNETKRQAGIILDLNHDIAVMRGEINDFEGE